MKRIKYWIKKYNQYRGWGQSRKESITYANLSLRTVIEANKKYGLRLIIAVLLLVAGALLMVPAPQYKVAWCVLGLGCHDEQKPSCNPCQIAGIK